MAVCSGSTSLHCEDLFIPGSLRCLRDTYFSFKLSELSFLILIAKNPTWGLPFVTGLLVCSVVCLDITQLLGRYINDLLDLTYIVCLLFFCFF